MFRMESNVVRKYFEPIDGFVKIRVFTPEETARLLSTSRITDKRSYVGLVLNACLLHYHDQILPRLSQCGAIADRLTLEEGLYSLVVEANPPLDIRHVTIPDVDEEVGELHLLDRPRLPGPRPEFASLHDLEAELSRRIIGQEEAVASVARAVRKNLTGLRDPAKPVATFLFVGRTGVGKTELAKALTLHLFRDPARMLRIDCSEFALPHEYAKLIGAPPGYVGHDQPGVLAEAARHNGEAVVLFDEVEKSDPKVHDLMLQMMDEGFVTDNKGSRIRFDNALIILTSNAGAREVEEVRNRMGFDSARRKGLDRQTVFDETLRALREHFRPEFLNRVTEVVLFNSIGLRECELIARRFLEDVQRHAASVPLTVHYTSQVPRFLAEKGFNPECGAREVKRTVEREVEGPLSDLLIDGRIHQGDVVEIRVHHNRLSFHRN
ncbi:MAG: ATP-dependent Clp protease ATP-binding subunit [Planctomycetes bacterium]|nr:ATP-dependent Clp protease ATP-binding subunit [Planctomycetota bacterium]